jgi:AP endonuclease-2
VLTPPNSTTSFYELPKSQQIGGYPSFSQLADCALDAAVLDSEGRCIVLEFPAFVLIGTYCPANRDETRDEFRIGFLTALDARVRNLVAMGKRVFLTGDLNIIRDEMDTANSEEQLRKQGITIEQYISTPARRMLNQLLVGGKVIGERDEGKEKPIMWDICRSFHPTRKGMFTCWEQKKNARPGNFGSRIDYVLCSEEWKNWFCESNIQEGLMGSDHCPVYAVLKNKVEIDGKEVHMKDLMSSGMFKDGLKQRSWTAKDLLPMSAKLIPEFDRRRSIKEMFARKSSASKFESFASMKDADSESALAWQDDGSNEVAGAASSIPSGVAATQEDSTQQDIRSSTASGTQAISAIANSQAVRSPSKSLKRSPATAPLNARPQKRGRNGPTKASVTGQAVKGQSSLKGFFKPAASPQVDHATEVQTSTPLGEEIDLGILTGSAAASEHSTPLPFNPETSSFSEPVSSSNFCPADQNSVIDPIVAKESWSKLLGKRVLPRCEHGEPCMSLVTKKPGVNLGRSFYMCPRPLGPSGAKERNSQWRCGTFIWSSEWTGDGS